MHTHRKIGKKYKRKQIKDRIERVCVFVKETSKIGTPEFKFRLHLERKLYFNNRLD
jgi:hypothetical protein